jgi:arginase
MPVVVAVELIGVPFDGWGREGHQARAGEVLRDAGLAKAFAGHAVRVRNDVFDLPAPDSGRAAGSGLLNQPALLAMVEQLHAAVSGSLAAGRFSVVSGADCSVLLGAVPALRDHAGSAGLVFVDGHEDTTPLDVSPDGEAANTELGLLLGATGQTAPDGLRRQLPALALDQVAVLGARDDVLRRSLGLTSLAERGVHVRRFDQVAADPAQTAVHAVAHVREAASQWWLHVDLDVVAQDLFIAQRVPGDRDEGGGLTWDQLTEVLVAAVAEEGCRGLSLSIYDPEQDLNGQDAHRIVRLAGDVAAHLPR